MRLDTLGGLALRATHGPTVTRPKPLLLLAYLAVGGRRSRAHLARVFWPDAADPRDSLAAALARLRAVAPELVRSEGSHLEADVPTDLDVLDRALADGDAERVRAAYPGAFLDGVPSFGGEELEAWVFDTRERIAGRVRHAFVAEAVRQARRGAWESVGDWATRAAHTGEAPPLEGEELRTLHDLLVAAGRPEAREHRAEAEALAATPEESGGEFVAASTDAARARFEEHGRSERKQGVEPSVDGTSDHLAGAPRSGSPTIGRERELARLMQLLNDGGPRWITLFGPGGVGKTRIAQDLAATLARDAPTERPDAPRVERRTVAWVDLAPATTAEAAAERIAAAVGASVGDRSDPLAAAGARLGRMDRPVLILDNLEAVVDAATALASVLDRAPGARIVATSRTAARIDGEVELPVAPLPVPAHAATVEEAMTSDAVRLLTERVRAFTPEFDPATHAHDLAWIARRLDGLPLALELAAARLRTYTPSDLRARLERDLRTLRRARRDRPERHRTLWTALAWSHDLLNADDRAVFRRLSVFRGAVPIEMATELVRAVERELGTEGRTPASRDPDAFEVEDRIESLLERSLLQRVDRDGVAGVTMLESLRAFAHERLEEAGEALATRRAHLRLLADRAEASAPELTGPDPGAAAVRLEAWRDEVHAALDHATRDSALTGDGLRLAAAWWRTWLVRDRLSEGTRRLEALIRTADAEGLANVCGDDGTDREHARLLAAVRNALATLTHLSDDHRRALPHLEAALIAARVAGDAREVGNVLNNLAWVRISSGELRTGERRARTALALNRRCRNARGCAVATQNLGWAALVRHDGTAAEGWFRESLAWHERHDDLRGRAFAATNLALTLLLQDRTDEADRSLSDAERILRGIRDRSLHGWLLRQRAIQALHAGEPVAAGRLAMRAVAHFRGVQQRSGMALALAPAATAATRMGDPRRGASRARLALKFADRVHEPYTRAGALEALAQAYVAVGDADDAFRAWVACAWARRRCEDRASARRALAEARASRDARGAPPNR